MNSLENTSLLVGRILMSVIFVHGGWGKLLGAAATQATFAKLGLPLPVVAWVIAVIVELGGGLLLLFGLFTRPVGLVLAAWCVATALIAHTNFAERIQEIQFMKNMAMTGGFLYVFALGAGAYSLDAALGRRRAAPVPG
ncbi:MAG TPA: DoxX family protein [Stellaceae bacterium]|nr:DoxX family protein [Stellaceae bacterium]